MARMGDKRGVYTDSTDRSEGKNHLENLGVDGRIILNWILKKQECQAWSGFIWLRIGTSSGLF